MSKEKYGIDAVKTREAEEAENELNLTPEEMAATIAAQQKAMEALFAENEALKSGQAASDSAALPTFSLGGKDYRFTVARFTIVEDGVPHNFTAADAVENADVLAYLVREKSGCIQRV